MDRRLPVVLLAANGGRRQEKWPRIISLVGLTLGLLALAVHWAHTRTGFATPASCLDAYREASLAGDVERSWRCLALSLRADIQRRHPNPKELAESMRREMKDVKTWVQLPALVSEGSTVQVNVDEVRIDGNRSIRFRLQRSENGWLITGIDPPKLVPAGIPYGTHVSKVPEEPQLGAQPPQP
jgi:hypothetical protein